LSLLLYINGQLADLDAGTVIAQTKQVNDLNSLETRQTNYTNKFRLPKTATNLKIMQFLTLPGNTSDIPYQKNECSLYSHSGECYVYKGWAVITDGGDSYDAAIYDGIIDLYKAIENKTLADLTLTEIDHVKDTATVIQTWDNTSTLPYRYILADFNGDTGATNNPNNARVNLDYLIPSVKVSYLWNKIFTKYNIRYSGSVFLTQNFVNLWITYPKGVSTSENDLIVFESDTYAFYNSSTVSGYRQSFWLQYNAASTNLLTSNGSQKHLKVTENGYYRIEAEGHIMIRGRATINFAKNGEPFALPSQIGASEELIGINNIPFTVSRGVYLNAGESICLFLKGYGSSFKFIEENTLTVRLVKVTPNNMNFTEAFSDFAITDFLKEVVHRFGLTLFKDRHTGNYTFLTLQEQLQAADAENWSSKFSKKMSENYVYGSYAQRNWFRYSYNDKENTGNDYYIDVPNVNLPESKDIIKSKIYSPEIRQSTYLNQSTNVYKFWDKEIKEADAQNPQSVSYKPLDKRYYFMRGKFELQPVNLYSDAFSSSVHNLFIYRENFYKLSYNDVVQEYYHPIKQLLEKAQLVNAELWLTDADVANFDFKKLYYIEQLSSYFIMNKINNYVPGKVTNCELVRVQYAAPPPEELSANYSISLVTVSALRYFTILFTRTTQLAGYVQISPDTINWTTLGMVTTSPYTSYALPVNDYPPGNYFIRIESNGYTNPQTITLP
jgi:hypothetical protein